MPRKAAATIDPDDAQAGVGHGRWTREGVKSYLERRYSTRLHMSAILAASGLVAMLASLVLVVFVTSGYLIWTGPDILAEAAFGALLAGGLARRTKRETAASWIAGVVKKTWWPFAVVLVAAVCLAAYAQKHYPAAHTMKQALAIAFP